MRQTVVLFKLGAGAQGPTYGPRGGGGTFATVPSFKRHIFVCINERSSDHPKGCCLARGGAAVRDGLKAELKKRGLSKVVRANNAGCLDQCEHGVTVVVYPEQVWYGGVTPADIEEIVEQHLIGGKPVQRLLLPDQPHLHGDLPALEIG
jgi:(2Fe-2S) ferredoxin